MAYRLTKTELNLHGRIYSRIVLLVTSIYLLSVVLVGPTRYYLDQLEYGWLAYAPNVLVAGVLGLALLLPQVNLPYVVALYVLVLFAVVGAFHIEAVEQVLFGFYVFSPFLLGLAGYRVFMAAKVQSIRYLQLLLVIVLVGFIFNLLHADPWVGYFQRVGGGAVEVSREWNTQGTPRLAGFSRASYDAAAQALLLGALVLVYGRNTLIKFVLWLAVGWVIYLSTTKGIIGAYIVLTGFILLRNFSTRLLWISLPIIVATIGILLPMSTLFTRYNIRLLDPVQALLLESSADRLSSTWPTALALVFEHGSWLLGRGVGGIGRAQVFFEPTLYNSADNLYVYLYGTMGLTALLLIMLFLAAVSRLAVQHDPADTFFYMVALSTLVYGVTNNVIESAFFSFFGGLLIAHLSAKRQQIGQLEFPR